MSENKTIKITGNDLSIDQLALITANNSVKVQLSRSALQNTSKSHEFLKKESGKHVIYGVNTGFGPMASHILGPDQLIDLQYNLIRSHAVGIGAPIAQKFVLAAMVVRLNTLAKGLSGVSIELLKTLQLFINERIVPVVPEHGAVGTSGDLVQLAQIALTLIGEGEVMFRGNRLPTRSVLHKLKITPYVLKPKEGLALINGTSVMSAIAALVSYDAARLIKLSVLNGAMSLEVVNAFDDGISTELHASRPHPGQVHIAAELRRILASSKLLKSRKNFYSKVSFKQEVTQIPEMVQEVYSLRCIPQILGPVYDTLMMVQERITTEINSVTDNPIVNWQKKSFIHGGNFHGDYIAASVDQLKMTLVKLTMLSERRLNFFLNRNVNRFLPPFLNLKKPGLTLGLQGLQFVATSTTAQSQTLAFPQYVHSIPTNGDNQDIVSMGTDAALMTDKVIDNAFIVLSIESLALAQAVDFLKLQPDLANASVDLYKKIRKTVPVIMEDRALNSDLARLIDEMRKI